MTNQQRRTARGATRPAPGPKRRAPKPHGRVSGRARPGDRRKRPEPNRVRVNPNPPRRRADAPGGGSLLRSIAKVTARALVGLVILAVFVFGVFPTGSYVEQRSELHDAERELAELQAENADLESRVDRLESDAEIERVAREDFGMGEPGEESYLILPPGK